MTRALALAALLVAACGPREPPHFPDAPIELRDDGDRVQAIDQLLALPAGPARTAARAAIADALAHRLADALEDDHPFAAAALLDSLASLWQPDPEAVGAELAPHVDVIRHARTVFARSGAIESAITAIVLLVEIDAPARAAHLAELDEALAFADDLAVAENGPHATRAQPIALLGPTVLALPLRWLVDRYVELVADRQRAVVLQIADVGATVEIVRAHHDILSSARRIAIALARAGRAGEIAAHVKAMTGIGAEPALATRAEIVADQPTAGAFADLARALRTDEHAADETAALAVCVAGLAKFPADATLLALAGELAAGLGRVDQPIAFYEAAVRAGDEIDPVFALRLGKLYAARIARLAASGRPGAATSAWHDLEHETVAHIWAPAAAEGEAALGKGLLTQGRVDDGEHALRAALERSPVVDAYETLATLDYQLDRLAPAQHWAAAGIAALGEGDGDGFRRARLERLSADIQRRGGDPHGAAELYLDALRSWAALGDARELPRPIAAQRLLESGRVMWSLGDPKRAVEAVLGAVDVDADEPAVATGAVAFLIEIGHYADALDAYHRGLDAPAITEDDKIAMSLWVAGEARRRGDHGDRIALEYLASRHGELWSEQLAEVASGRRAFAALRAAATTAPRRAELAYYGAVLGLDPASATAAGTRKLLGEMVDSQLVMDAEYDLARVYLSAGSTRPVTGTP